MRFKTLSNEALIDIYLTAYEQKLNDSFLKMLLDEIMERDMYDLLLETSSQSDKKRATTQVTHSNLN